MKKILITLTLSIILGSQVVFAQATTSANTLPPDASDLDYRLMEPLPFVTKYETQNVGVDGKPITVYRTDLPTYVQGMYRLALVVGTVLAVFMVIVGGFKYVTSVIPNVKLDGKADINNALIGLAWLFGSVLLIEIINPQLTRFTQNIIPNLNIQKVYLNTTGMSLSQYDQSNGRLNAQINDLKGKLTRAKNDEERTNIQSELNTLYEQRGRIQVLYNLQRSVGEYANNLWSKTGTFNTDVERDQYIANNKLAPIITENTNIATENNLPILKNIADQVYVVNNGLADYMADTRALLDPNIPRTTVEQRLSTRITQEMRYAEQIQDPTLKSFYINQINSFKGDLEGRLRTRDCLKARQPVVPQSGYTLPPANPSTAPGC